MEVVTSYLQGPIIIGSSRGGVNIEEVAATEPSAIVKASPFEGRIHLVNKHFAGAHQRGHWSLAATGRGSRHRNGIRCELTLVFLFIKTFKIK